MALGAAETTGMMNVQKTEKDIDLPREQKYNSKTLLSCQTLVFGENL